MPGPLDGIKVVEFTEIIAGPLAGMLLAGRGAEVSKIKPPPVSYTPHTLPTQRLR